MTTYPCTTEFVLIFMPHLQVILLAPPPEYIMYPYCQCYHPSSSYHHLMPGILESQHAYDWVQSWPKLITTELMSNIIIVFPLDTFKVILIQEEFTASYKNQSPVPWISQCSTETRNSWESGIRVMLEKHELTSRGTNSHIFSKA